MTEAQAQAKALREKAEKETPGIVSKDLAAAETIKAANKAEKKKVKVVSAVALKNWKCDIAGHLFDFKEGEIVKMNSFEFKVLAEAEVVSVYKTVRI